MDLTKPSKEKVREYMERRKIERRDVNRRPIHDIEEIRKELGWDRRKEERRESEK